MKEALRRDDGALRVSRRSSDTTQPDTTAPTGQVLSRRGLLAGVIAGGVLVALPGCEPGSSPTSTGTAPDTKKSAKAGGDGSTDTAAAYDISTVNLPKQIGNILVEVDVNHDVNDAQRSTAELVRARSTADKPYTPAPELVTLVTEVTARANSLYQGPDYANRTHRLRNVDVQSLEDWFAQAQSNPTRAPQVIAMSQILQLQKEGNSDGVNKLKQAAQVTLLKYLIAANSGKN